MLCHTVSDTALCNAGWVTHEANLLKGSFTLSWEICWYMKNIFSCCWQVYTLDSMVSISRDIFSRGPCWLTANKKYVTNFKREIKVLLPLSFVCELSSTE